MIEPNEFILKQHILRWKRRYPGINNIQLTEIIYQNLADCVYGENVKYNNSDYRIIIKTTVGYIIENVETLERIDAPKKDVKRSLSVSRNKIKKIIEILNKEEKEEDKPGDKEQRMETTKGKEEPQRIKNTFSSMQGKIVKKRSESNKKPIPSQMIYNRETGKFVPIEENPFRNPKIKKISQLRELSKSGDNSFFQEKQRERRRVQTQSVDVVEEIILPKNKFSFLFLSSKEQISRYLKIFSFIDLFGPIFNISNFTNDRFKDMIFDLNTDFIHFTKYFIGVMIEERKRLKNSFTVLLKNVMENIYGEYGEKKIKRADEKIQWFNSKAYTNDKLYLKGLASFLAEIELTYNYKNIIDFNFSPFYNEYFNSEITATRKSEIEDKMYNRLILVNMMIDLLCETATLRNIVDYRLLNYKEFFKRHQLSEQTLRRLNFEKKRETGEEAIGKLNDEITKTEGDIEELEAVLFDFQFTSYIGQFDLAQFILLNKKYLYYVDEKNNLNYIEITKENIGQIKDWLNYIKNRSRKRVSNEEMAKMNFYMKVLLKNK